MTLGASHPVPRYRAIFFDLDGTLLDERRGTPQARAAAAAALRARGHALDDATFSAAVQRAVDAAVAANGGLWPPDYRREAMLAAALRHLALPQVLAEPLAAAYRDERRRHLRLLPDARAVVRAARDLAPVGLISNGPSEEQREKLRATGLHDLFDAVVISDDIGVHKPHPRIFQHALAALQAPAEAAVYVGNSYHADVEGAWGAGMDSLWVNAFGDAPRPGAARPRGTVTRLRDVLPFLRRPTEEERKAQRG